MTRSRTRRGMRRGRTAAAVATVIGTAAALVACGSDAPAELVDVRWQITRIEDAPAEESGTAVANGLSQTDQTRSWIALGGNTSFTGAIGCMALSGSIEWMEDEKVHFEDLKARDASEEDGTDCMPNDEALADRLIEVLDDAELTWSTPSDEEMRLTRKDDKVADWQTKRFVEFIATY
ncbi:MAG TPA: hypothetical protein H9870_03135 [Candidatus Corynebacterium avicola]|uniref:Uncharacterized protein n=1 Tax=Candidatus Corynebacterium avicola TaxID=2838527 RepID=A0A9D1UKE4_9CORY|nr:hypothetical protein [Candidatus Corynebacterium avicola]